MDRGNRVPEVGSVPGANQEELFTFSVFWGKMLGLHQTDNQDIKAILCEINKFRDLAEKANEINKVVQQLDGYEGQEIKITLGMSGSIQWPADELIGRTNAMMGDTVLALKQQQMIIARMAQAISGNVEVEPEIGHLFDIDDWLRKWKRDIAIFFSDNARIFANKRAQNALEQLGRAWHQSVFDAADDETVSFGRDLYWPEDWPPSFADALPLVIEGVITVRNCGDVMKQQLQQALDLSQRDESVLQPLPPLEAYQE